MVSVVRDGYTQPAHRSGRGATAMLRIGRWAGTSSTGGVGVLECRERPSFFSRNVWLFLPRNDLSFVGVYGHSFVFSNTVGISRYGEQLAQSSCIFQREHVEPGEARIHLVLECDGKALIPGFQPNRKGPAWKTLVGQNALAIATGAF